MTAHIGHVAHMAMMGLLVSVFAPVLLLGTLRLAPRSERWALPAAFVLPWFVVLHFAITAWSGYGSSALLTAAVPLVLLVSAMLFWVPVLGSRHRLPDAGRTIYLYTAMPLLDLAGVWRVIIGDSTGGLSMIVGMLPLGLAAVAVTWRWINREERDAERRSSRAPVRPTGERADVHACTGRQEFHREPEW